MAEKGLGAHAASAAAVMPPSKCRFLHTQNIQCVPRFVITQLYCYCLQWKSLPLHTDTHFGLVFVQHLRPLPARDTNHHQPLFARKHGTAPDFPISLVMIPSLFCSCLNLLFQPNTHIDHRTMCSSLLSFCSSLYRFFLLLCTKARNNYLLTAFQKEETTNIV